MPHELCQWSKAPVIKQDGVIVGCTRSHEWILPWWYMHFRMHNEHPITFFDFGNLSSSAKEWCKARGQLVILPETIEYSIVKKEAISSELVTRWEGHQNLDVWNARKAWFKKPFACLNSPYERTLWIDLDCQVRKMIDPIFLCCENPLKIAVVEEPDWVLEKHVKHGYLYEGEMEYNTGVIAFKHGCELIKQWAQACVENNHTQRGDQEVLAQMLFVRDLCLPTLPSNYNKRGYVQVGSEGDLKIDESVVILHWVGIGKEIIETQMELLQHVCFVDFNLR